MTSSTTERDTNTVSRFGSVLFILAGIIMLTTILSLAGCAKSTKNLKPVKGFELQRYLGTWYEIARFPHSFERGLTDVTANYSMREDGKIKVVNRGYSKDKKKFKSTTAVAKPASQPDLGHLKVSFFPLFWADYKIVYLADDYSVAIVTSSNYDYLWFLARKPEISDKLYEELRKRAVKMDFDLEKLKKVSQTRAK